MYMYFFKVVMADGDQLHLLVLFLGINPTFTQETNFEMRFCLIDVCHGFVYSSGFFG